MIELMVILLGAVSMGAVLIGLALVCIGSGHEDRWATLRYGPPTRAAATARRMTGLYVRMPQAQAEHEVKVSE
jgi:hypothetical protein